MGLWLQLRSSRPLEVMGPESRLNNERESRELRGNRVEVQKLDGQTGLFYSLLTPLNSLFAAGESGPAVLHERCNLHELDARAHTIETGDPLEQLIGEERFRGLL